ncbi:MAG: hypothetical protein IKI78_06100 [Clostridia bacterium]|nr:hypothetical protein [Clostridia bacterium]
MKRFRPVFTTEALVFAASLIILLPLRTVQYYTNIESGNGFYKKVDALVIIYIIALIAAIGYFIAMGLKKRNSVCLESRAQRFPACGAISFLTGFAVLYGVYSDYMLSKKDASEFTVTSTATSAIGEKLVLVQAAFGILSAVFFILLAVLLLTGKSPSLFKLLSLSVPMWYIIKLIIRFTRTISYLRVSDLAVEMIALVFLASFFMAFAQINSGVETKGNEWKIAGLGFPAALLALNLFIPRIALVLTGRDYAMYILSYADFSDLAVSLFILATILTRMVPNITKVEVKSVETEDTAV